MRFLRKGKVKEVYEVSEDELEFVFTDQGLEVHGDMEVF